TTAESNSRPCWLSADQNSSFAVRQILRAWTSKLWLAIHSVKDRASSWGEATNSSVYRSHRSMDVGSRIGYPRSESYIRPKSSGWRLEIHSMNMSQASLKRASCTGFGDRNMPDPTSPPQPNQAVSILPPSMTKERQVCLDSTGRIPR